MTGAKPKLVLHIGYHRTGTTALQRAIPAALQTKSGTPTLYIGRYYDPVPQSHARINQLIAAFAHSVAINEFEVGHAVQLRSFLLNWFGSGHDFVISHENFLRPSNFLNIDVQLGALAQSFDLQVVVTLRRLTDLILSRYRQDLIITHRHRLGLVYRDVPINGQLTHHELAALRGDPNVLYDVAQAFQDDFSCAYPYCGLPEPSGCACMAQFSLKAINPEFYRYGELLDRLQARLGSERVSGVFFIDEMKRSVPSIFDRLLGLRPGAMASVTHGLKAKDRNTGHSGDGGLFDARIEAARPVVEQLVRETFQAEEDLYRQALGGYARSVDARADHPATALVS